MLLQSGCQVCGPRGDVPSSSLFKCTRCQAVLYCGRDHQREDFSAHKSICKRVKKCRDLMAKEAEEVRNAEEDYWTPANAFETHVGHFWGIRNTRPYMRAKMEVIRSLSTIESRPAIEAALAEAMDCLRLCRGDNMGVRDVVPTLMLQLGKYQEAYDFIKWYETSGNASDYDWGDMDLPYLDVHNADMTEGVEGFRRTYSLFFLASLTYIKMSLAAAVQDSINAQELADHASLPAGVTVSLGAFLAPSGNTKSVAELKELHKKLTRQTRELFSLTHTKNKHYWGAMLDPAPIVEMPDPQYYSAGDVNEVRIWVVQNAVLWSDHVKFIRETRGKK